MDPKNFLNQMIQFSRATFNNSFDAINVLQEHTEKMFGKYVDQLPLLPDEGKKAIGEWLRAYKKGCVDFKIAMDANYKKVEAFFTGLEESAKPKDAKPKPETENVAEAAAPSEPEPTVAPPEPEPAAKSAKKTGRKPKTPPAQNK